MRKLRLAYEKEQQKHRRKEQQEVRLDMKNEAGRKDTRVVRARKQELRKVYLHSEVDTLSIALRGREQDPFDCCYAVCGAVYVQAAEKRRIEKKKEQERALEKLPEEQRRKAQEAQERKAIREQRKEQRQSIKVREIKCLVGVSFVNDKMKYPNICTIVSLHVYFCRVYVPVAGSLYTTCNASRRCGCVLLRGFLSFRWLRYRPFCVFLYLRLTRGEGLRAARHPRGLYLLLRGL